MEAIIEQNQSEAVEEELWRTCVDIAGYEVSTLGNVRRVGRVRCVKPRIINERVYVYLAADPSEDDRRSYAVMALVAHAWLGECPANCIPGHLDGDTTNNRLDNIRYMTHAEARGRLGAFRAKSLPARSAVEIQHPVSVKMPSPEYREKINALAELLADNEPHTAAEIMTHLGLHVPAGQYLSQRIGVLLNIADAAGLLCYEDNGQIGLSADRRAEYAVIAEQRKADAHAPTPIRIRTQPRPKAQQQSEPDPDPELEVQSEAASDPSVPEPQLEPIPARSVLKSWGATSYKRHIVAGSSLLIKQVVWQERGHWCASVGFEGLEHALKSTHCREGDPRENTLPTTPEGAVIEANRLARELVEELRAAVLAAIGEAD